MVATMTPSRAEQDALHDRLLKGDPTASARIFEALLEPLVDRLEFKWPRLDRRDIEEQAADSLISYITSPHRYDPSRASLLTYLTLDADGDLKNAYRSPRRRREQLASDVEDPLFRRNETTDAELFAEDDRALFARLRVAFPSEADRQVIHLLLEGERSTAAYAEVLGIADLSPEERRAEVKRVKDRIKKKVGRLFGVDQ
jgi:hypothetical protein